ncbi:DoxX family protein [Candidatus Methanoperedens nitratireducens]|uniref:Putative membrane protein n=1 Tax=Candidatus Methanoperedens nitratireducens TaxID=1392998 RepID=A0A284VTB7_9EURY|nr:DoxX family protein [Candidatus Methanoperedens nitroreducens]SNQ62541.1 putative membrane protein [Candidatus Methanoperedens nitroreducens]
MSFNKEKTQNYSLVILRAALGVIFFAHGSQKLLGWFGGYGFDATVQFFNQQLGIPSALAVLAILAEFFGGLMVLLGFFTRIGAAGIGVTMAVALYTVHLPQGFFIAGGKVGFEYVFALLLMALYLVINGAGELSVDRHLNKKGNNGLLEKLLS